MKTKITMLMLVSVATASFGQESVFFKNDQHTRVRFFAGEPVPTDTWQVQLFWTDAVRRYTPWDMTSMNPEMWLWENQGAGWRLAGTPTKIGPEPGLFDGGTLSLGYDVPDHEIAAIVISWPRWAENFEDVSSPYAVGISDIFIVRTGDPNSDPPVPPGSLTEPVPGYSVFTGVTVPTMVPEPSTAALVAFGWGIWLLRRGRVPGAQAR